MMLGDLNLRNNLEKKNNNTKTQSTVEVTGKVAFLHGWSRDTGRP